MTRRLIRWCAALVTMVGALAGVTACGFDVQTLQPYTQADGVNFQIGDLTKDPNQQVLKVRNLMVLADQSGKAFLSGSLIINPAVGKPSGSDTLQSISGTVLKPSGDPGAAVKFDSFTPVRIASAQLTILTDSEPITVTSSDIKPGGTLRLVLTFAQAGEYSVTVPVVDRTNSEYKTVTPAPSASSTS